MARSRGTHDEVADDHGEEEEGHAHGARAVHAVPHRLDPFPAQHAEDDHERVQEVLEVPARHALVRELLDVVVLAEQLHAHDGEDEDDDDEHEAQVAEGAHRPADDPDEQVERWPRLGQFEDTKLEPSTQRSVLRSTLVIIIIKLYLDTIKSGTYVPFTGVCIYKNR